MPKFHHEMAQTFYGSHCDCFAEEWRHDGYRWKQIGQSWIPRNNTQITKLHYQIQQPTGLSEEFRKYVYKVPAHSNIAVGNETVAVDFPQGNVKRRTDS